MAVIFSNNSLVTLVHRTKAIDTISFVFRSVTVQGPSTPCSRLKHCRLRRNKAVKVWLLLALIQLPLMYLPTNRHWKETVILLLDNSVLANHLKIWRGTRSLSLLLCGCSCYTFVIYDFNTLLEVKFSAISIVDCG